MIDKIRNSVDRRQFLKTGASVLAKTGASVLAAPGAVSLATAAPPRSPNDRIQVGVVGLGSRGFNLIDALIEHRDQARIVAISDVDQMHYRDRPWGTGTAYGLIPAKEKIAKAYATRKSESADGLGSYGDYRELIARNDIDAVVVATPDHWHALCTIAALRAGKDVYCEKPVTHLFAEGQRICREIKKQQAIFQTGSQQRSDWRFRRAVELARGGHLGSIQQIQVGLPPGYDKPQGDTKVIEIPRHLDYDFWCGPSPKLPYMRARHHRWWRGHRAYGGGVLMDWIGHHNDIAHWAIDMDNAGPKTVQAVGWTFPETDVYDTPHHYTIRCEYPGNIESTISTQNENGLKLIGSAGWVYVNRGKLRASDDRWIAENFDPGGTEAYVSDDHMGNFLSCMRSRRQCIAPAETAHRSITPGHLGYVSNAVGRQLQWDPHSETVVGDQQADQMLRRMSYREPWSLA